AFLARGLAAAAARVRGFEVAQPEMPVRTVRDRQRAQPLQRIGQQPTDVADALLEIAVLRARMDFVPVAIEQSGHGPEPQRHAGEAVDLSLCLGEPGGQAQVLGPRLQQLAAHPLRGGPVRVLDVGDPFALLEGGVVGAPGFLDGVEFGREGQVVTGRLRVGDGSQQVFQFQHGGARSFRDVDGGFYMACKAVPAAWRRVFCYLARQEEAEPATPEEGDRHPRKASSCMEFARCTHWTVCGVDWRSLSGSTTRRACTGWSCRRHRTCWWSAGAGRRRCRRGSRGGSTCWRRTPRWTWTPGWASRPNSSRAWRGAATACAAGWCARRPASAATAAWRAT